MAFNKLAWDCSIKINRIVILKGPREIKTTKGLGSQGSNALFTFFGKEESSVPVSDWRVWGSTAFPPW